MKKGRNQHSLSKVAIIRQRGQITIPDSIRKSARWITANQPVNISIAGDREIIITPATNDATDWDHLWQEIDKVRSLPGKKADVSKFIAADRTKH